MDKKKRNSGAQNRKIKKQKVKLQLASAVPLLNWVKPNQSAKNAEPGNANKELDAVNSKEKEIDSVGEIADE